MTTQRILAVEDSPAQAALLDQVLRDGGFEVTLAPDGETALDHLLAQTFDLVVSDVVMPGIDGYELCGRIKDLLRDLPVILLTSLDDPIEIVHGLEAGADNFLRKPYEAEQLVTRIRTMLYHREMRATGRASMGLEVLLRDRRFLITAERQQILDLLMSSFEDLVTSNKELQSREQALRAAEESLRTELSATERERRRLATVLGAAPHAIVLVDSTGTITDVSDNLCLLAGHDRADLVGWPAEQVLRFADAGGHPLPPGQRPLAASLASGGPTEAGASFDLFLQRGHQPSVPVIVRWAPVHDASGVTLAIVGVIHEIGTLSAHDSVTHLPHQALFADRVAGAVAGAAGSSRWVAVLALVVDNFASLSENLSPPEVATLLARIADRLRTALADVSVSGSAGYFGHDTFAAVLPGLDDELDAVHRADALAKAVATGVLRVGEHTLDCSVTVGLALDDGSVDDPIGLVSAAVGAARRAGATGGGQVRIADSGVDARADDWLRRQAELRTAIDEGQLVLHYQPEIDLRTEEGWGVEALVRWDHPDHGLLMPDVFLPLARETGLIAALGWSVLAQACQQVATWRCTLPAAAHMALSVNIDARQLADPTVATRVSTILGSTGLDPTALVLEITEHGVMDDAQRAADCLRELKVLGVRVAIDDFGTGYSSLMQLRHFPVDFLKVDREFVDGMTTEPDDATIVAATIRLARALGIDAVAEGVETEDQLVQLRLLGCDYAQGYHWAPALPAAELEQWWTAHAEEVAAAPPVGVDRDPLDEDADGALDDVLAYLIHELRSPLTVIAGYASLVLTAADDELAASMNPILRGAKELEQRLSSLADVRDSAHGAIRLSLTTVDVGEAVETLVTDLAPQLAPHPVTVHAEPGALVRADLSRVCQCVTNLLLNAAKFSEPTAPIEVEVASGDHCCRIAVRDHGPGVPEDRRPELFRRFARLGSRHSGMGVGLHLVSSIARAHGGEASYEPAPGGGSQFVISLPVLTAEATERS